MQTDRPGRIPALTSVNLKLLNAFLAVAEHHSFRRAAEASYRSQSAISMQIRQLEEQLGVALFHRTTRRVQLTSEGEDLLQSVRRAIGTLEQGLNRLRETADLERGTLSLACVPTISSSWLPGVLASFRSRYPGVTMYLRELPAVELMEVIRRQEVDFGIGPRVDHVSDLRFQTILTDEICVLAPRDYKVGSRSADRVGNGRPANRRMAPQRAPMPVVARRLSAGITLAQFNELPSTLMLGHSSALRGVIEEAMKLQGITLSTKFEMMNAQTLIAMVQAGLGAAILPRIALPDRLPAAVQVLPIVDPPIVREICIVTLAGQALSPAGMRLATALLHARANP